MIRVWVCGQTWLETRKKLPKVDFFLNDSFRVGGEEEKETR